MRYDFVICFHWKHLIISCTCWNCRAPISEVLFLILCFRWKYLDFWIPERVCSPNIGKKMFYVLNKCEAKVTDALFIAIFENVPQVYWYHIFYRELVAEIEFKLSLVLADAVKEMFLLCIMAANFWLTHRTEWTSNLTEFGSFKKYVFLCRKTAKLWSVHMSWGNREISIS